MNDIFRFHVPCKLEYIKLVEDITEQISSYLKPSDATPEFQHKLRAVMNEVFINIVTHSNTADVNEIVRFQFELGLEFFTVSIYDYGPGFEAEGYFPPYPKDIVGKKFKLREVLDGNVFFTIVDPFEVSFSFEEKEETDLDQLDDLNMLHDHGLGISIVTKLMDNVTYTYIGQGKFDWKLIKRLG